MDPILLVVPPFHFLDRGALGVHLLQAVGRRAGFQVDVLYANALFHAQFGERAYATLSSLHWMFLGDRLFARAAYGGLAMGRDGGAALVPRIEELRERFARSGNPGFNLSLDALKDLEAQLPAWIDSWVATTAKRGYRIVGCSSSFEQNSVSIAILSAFKRLDPSIITLMGGANCEGEMAEGIISLSDDVDWVFSGESDSSFPRFLEELAAEREPESKIINGEPCTDMDGLPTPDYGQYYTQLSRLRPNSNWKDSWVLQYETSRGCWWGQKSHCTFCGLNGTGIAMREKSPDRVIEELSELLLVHPTNKVIFADNIMPHAYFRTLLPRIAEELPGLDLMYEQKANLKFEQVEILKAAGVNEIQPGIEALSTGLLKHMAKGTSAGHNIRLLRFAASVGMRLFWNLLYGFPGDRLSFYRETLELIPLLHHLMPPRRVNRVQLDRFSPYFNSPEKYGVRNLRPGAVYSEMLPARAELGKVAYHFQADYDSVASTNPEVMDQLCAAVDRWQTRFFKSTEPAQLRVSRAKSGRLHLVDTRGLTGLPESQPIDDVQAEMALVPRTARSSNHDEYAWALEHHVAVERDGRFIALAVAEPDLLREVALVEAGSTRSRLT